MSEPLVGIDLGTTMSVVAHLRPDGIPETIANDIAEPLTPSVVYLDGNQAWVGKAARKRGMLKPDKMATFIKREMGKPAYGRTVDGRRLRPETLSAIILRKLKMVAERKLGVPVHRAVITVPAYFDDSRRKSTEDAGKIAGLEVYDILPEPTAAALSYAIRAHRLAGDQGPIFEIPGGEMTALVYDLGGGTFDVTAVKLRSKRFETVATDGDHQLGGKDWDDAIVNYVAEAFKRQFGVDPRSSPAAREKLGILAEDTKILLSDVGEDEEVPIEFTFEQHPLTITITRRQFEAMTSNLLVQTRLTTEQLVRRAARLRWEDLDHVLLVGGSTRMPMVREMLRSMAGRPPNHELDADQVVAQGAAIHAGIVAARAGEVLVDGYLEMDVKNVIAHSLGVHTITPNGIPRNTILIPKNTQLPYANSYVFRTAIPGVRHILVKVLQGDAPDPDNCMPIGECRVTGLPQDLPRGSLVQVRMACGNSGLVNVMALDMTYGTFGQTVLERRNLLSPADIAREAEFVQNLQIH